MAWIRTVDEDEVTGPLRQVYEAELARLGFVMEATKALSIKPELAQASEIFTGAVKQASSLTPQQRRLISLTVADRLGSTYCVLVYAVEVEREVRGLIWRSPRRGFDRHSRDDRNYQPFSARRSMDLSHILRISAAPG